MAKVSILKAVCLLQGHAMHLHVSLQIGCVVAPRTAGNARKLESAEAGDWSAAAPQIWSGEVCPETLANLDGSRGGRPMSLNSRLYHSLVRKSECSSVTASRGHSII